MHYIKDQHGNIINAYSVVVILSLVQEVWVELNISSAALLIWENMDIKIKKGFYQAMVADFFKFQLWDSNWKAEQYVIDNCGLWYLKWHAQIQLVATDYPGKHIKDEEVESWMDVEWLVFW